jgi:hypothetical protein
LKFRAKDINPMSKDMTRYYIGVLKKKGYLHKERFTYTITEKAFSDKKYFDSEYKKRLMSGNVWM